MRKSIPLFDLTREQDLRQLKAMLSELYARVDFLDPRTDDPSGEELYEGRIWIRTDL